MKSKKGPSRKTEDSSNINVPPPPPQQQSNVGNSLFTNVQQQQTSNNLPPTFQMNDMPPQVFQLPQQTNDWSLPQVSNANFAQQQNSIFSQPQVSNAKFAQQQNSLFSQQQMPVMQQQMPMMQQQMPMMQQQVRGGIYGSRRGPSNVPSNSQAFFNDDQVLIEKVKEEKKDARIDIQIKAQRSMAKLKEQVMLPAMVSLKTEGGSRTSVDLICVIDVSGSMNGQKIQLVKSTMKYLLQALTPADRLSIITFQSWGQRVCGLKCVTPQNMISLTEHVNGLSARGGTNICSGLDLAVKTIKQRKHTNKVTSIFLLSDGQDKGAEATFKKTLENQGKNLGIFSIHSFGFGTDHDEDLMTKLCQLKEGSFYFIKQLATLDEAFCNALGGVISMVATDVVIKLTNISKNIVEGIRIKYTYGDMWQRVNDNEYKIKILQLMSGISKDYVFEIQIPRINTEVGDLDRDHDILEAIYTAKGVDSSNMSGECSFKLTLLNQNEEIPEINENIDVIENHLRVVASIAIEENMKKAEKNQFKQAQQGIDSMINYIQSNKRARKQKMQYLVNDLQNIKQKCSSQNEYQNQGKKWMKSAQIAHTQQNNYAYSNKVQQEMVADRRATKKSMN